MTLFRGVWPRREILWFELCTDSNRWELTRVNKSRLNSRGSYETRAKDLFNKIWNHYQCTSRANWAARHISKWASVSVTLWPCLELTSLILVIAFTAEERETYEVLLIRDSRAYLTVTNLKIFVFVKHWHIMSIGWVDEISSTIKCCNLFKSAFISFLLISFSYARHPS